MGAAELHRSLRRLPSVDELLRSDGVRRLLTRFPRWAVVEAVRRELAARREALRGEGERRGEVDGEAQVQLEDDASTPERLETRATALVRPSLRRVLNATGVVLHTNLGRAPLSARALSRVNDVAAGYSTLEYDPARRGRGVRHEHVEELLTSLSGAEAAVVVNNNAGAVLVALSALAAGRRVVVSRGELVEIGGGFRVPDVMRASGALLVEVGTTNKTRLTDYLAAVDTETALLLKVHRSNFAMVGFTEDTPVAALAAAARPRGLPVMVDLGSGALVDLGAHGLPSEPTVDAVVRQGADLVTFSGDKLLGGPQAGIVVGRHELCARIAAHPLMRALRPDKLSLAALEATLESYRDGTALSELPALVMLTTPLAVLEARKDRLLALGHAATAGTRLVLGARRLRSAVGGGALPLAEPETWAVTVRHAELSADDLAGHLLQRDPPIVSRIVEDCVTLDVRTLGDDELPAVAEALGAASRATVSSGGAPRRDNPENTPRKGGAS